MTVGDEDCRMGATLAYGARMNKGNCAVLIKRLDICIALLLRLVERDGSKLSIREQIQTLDSLGLRPVEIANVLGKTQTYVNKELVGIRKRR